MKIKLIYKQEFNIEVDSLEEAICLAMNAGMVGFPIEAEQEDGKVVSIGNDGQEWWEEDIYWL